MRIAIPMAGGKFSEHFGGARDFLIFEARPQSPLALEAELLPAPEHKPGSLPKWLIDREVDAVVASAIGERALFMLAEGGVETFLASDARAPSDLASACLQGKLVRANQENSNCDGSHHHDKAEQDCGHHGKDA